MIKRKTSDVALISISPQHLEKAQSAIKKIKSTRWAFRYAKRQGKLLVRRRATKRWSKKAASGLEGSLKKALPEGSYNLLWSWTAGGDEFYFPGTEIMVLFDQGTSQAERKRILSKIKGVKVSTSSDFEVEALRRPTKRSSRRKPLIPGVSKSKQAQARQIWENLYPNLGEEKAPVRRPKIRMPVARVSVPESRRDELFAIANKIKNLPKVRAATPDVSILGRNVLGVPQQIDRPSTSTSSVHEKNRVDLAWRLINPADLDAPGDVFLASRERVALVDRAFDEHSQIDFEWIGYDVADQDQDPRIPEDPNPNPHGLWMSGVIGGQAQDAMNLAGMAPGAVIVPVRPTWGTVMDFIASEGPFAELDEYTEQYAAKWIDSIFRLYQLSHMGVEIANIPMDAVSKYWDYAPVDLYEWLAWWLIDGNWGEGVFACAAAGDDFDPLYIAIPAIHPTVFAVGWGQEDGYNMFGNYGWGLDLVVDDGRWPRYNQDGTVTDYTYVTGGSSAMSAVVAATAAMMKTLDPSLTPERIIYLLRLTARKIPPSIAAPSAVNSTGDWELTEDSRYDFGPGYCTEFGYGFLDAHYALEAVWRKRRPAAELQRVRYRPEGSGQAVIQQRFPPSSPLAGKRMGKFWSHTCNYNAPQQRWLHDRDFRLNDCDQAVDYLGLPFGEFTVAGDFNGDGEHELALQLHYKEFWPEICNHSAHCMLAFRFDPADEQWDEFGSQSPYASGLVSPQIVIPPNQPLRGMFAADLKGDNRDCLVVWGGETISALQYDEASDTFLRLDSTPFAPAALSPAVHLATGQRAIIDQRILGAVPFDRGGKIMLLLVSSFTKLGVGVELGTAVEFEAASSSPEFSDTAHLPHLPGTIPPFEFSPSEESGGSTGRSLLQTYLTVSIIEYDPTISQWKNWPFSSDPEDTHILLDEDSGAKLETILIDDFVVPGSNTYQEIAIHLANDNIHTLHLSSVAGAFSITGIYKATLSLDSRISKLHSGKFGLEGEKAQLAWLSDTEQDNTVHFLKWDNDSHTWQDAGNSISHGRPDNKAIDLTVLSNFSFYQLDGDWDVIALLLEKPDANIYLTYRYSETEGFQPIGII